MEETNVSEDWFEKASREAGLMRFVFCGEPVCYKNRRGHICGVIKEEGHYYYCFKDNGDESLSIVSHEEMRKIVQKKTLLF